MGDEVEKEEGRGSLVKGKETTEKVDFWREKKIDIWREKTVDICGDRYLEREGRHLEKEKRWIFEEMIRQTLRRLGNWEVEVKI